MALLLGRLGYAQIKKPSQQWKIDGIAAALKDPIPSVRIAALKEISSSYDRLPFNPIVSGSFVEVAELLNDPDPEVRSQAASELGQIEAKEQTANLVKLLTDVDARVRRDAAEALGKIGAKEHTADLVKLLTDGDEIVRENAAEALGDLQATEQSGEVATLLTDQASGVRASAAEALGEMHANEQAGKLIKLLKDPDQDVRTHVATALVLMYPKKATDKQILQHVIRLLKDPNPDIRSAAVGVLDDASAYEEVGEVAKLLKDPNPAVRASAAEAVWSLDQDSKHARDLAQLLSDRVPEVRAAAAEALGRDEAKEQKADLLNLLTDEYATVRAAATEALGHLQATEDAGEVVKLLKDRDADVRTAAVGALAEFQLHSKDQLGELVKLLSDADPSIRSSVAEALGRGKATGQAGELVKLLSDADPSVRSSAAKALGEMKANDHVGELVKVLNDPIAEVRLSAATALAAMQAAKAEEVQKTFAVLLRDPDPNIRSSAGKLLVGTGPVPEQMVPIMAEGYYFSHRDQAEIRFLCHYLTGATPSTELVLNRLMFEGDNPQQTPLKFASLEQARAALNALHKLLPAKSTDSAFSADAERQIIQIVSEWNGSWAPQDSDLIVSLARQMRSDNAAALLSLIDVPWWKAALAKLWKLIVIQIILWIFLVGFYPSSTQVQAFFFWNRWARRFIGLGYVDLCLTWIPFLRDRLLAPFREELLADARIEDTSLDAYFKDVQVLTKERTMALQEAIAQFKGQTILEGESGLGKSMCLRIMAKSTQEPLVFLLAENCDNGVFEAIQRKLQGKAGDPLFLKSIIWSGGLKIIIDGLNEVTVETREKIRRFLDDFPKAHVVIATQVILWKKPPKARVIRLLRLSDDRILKFLESRYPPLDYSIGLSKEEYIAKCRAYLAEVTNSSQSEEERSTARLVLSNPMDLTTAAEILLGGDTPTLKSLQDQQFQKVKLEFRETHPYQEFPIQQFSETVYERLLINEVALDATRFFDEIKILVGHKMALGLYDADIDGQPTQKWIFRHDKIRDYFLVQAFDTDRDVRILRHIDDPRFRGVYLLFASFLPLDQARELKDALVDHAAETKDHFLSDAVVEVLKARKSALTYS